MLRLLVVESVIAQRKKLGPAGGSDDSLSAAAVAAGDLKVFLVITMTCRISVPQSTRTVVPIMFGISWSTGQEAFHFETPFSFQNHHPASASHPR